MFGYVKDFILILPASYSSVLQRTNVLFHGAHPHLDLNGYSTLNSVDNQL